MQNELKPRQHAAIILALTDREARKAALAAVPAQDRACVEFYVRDYFARKNKTALPSWRGMK